MTAFLITRIGSRDWDLPVFHAGDNEAITVFTSATRAATYLSNSGLEHDHQVSEVSAVELMEITLAAHGEGIAYMAVDPSKQRQAAGLNQKVLVLDARLAEFEAELKEILALDGSQKGSLAE